jgi:hypothetical protein
LLLNIKAQSKLFFARKSGISIKMSASEWNLKFSIGGKETTLTLIDTLAIGLITAAVLLNVVSVLIPKPRAQQKGDLLELNVLLIPIRDAEDRWRGWL